MKKYGSITAMVRRVLLLAAVSASWSLSASVPVTSPVVDEVDIEVFKEADTYAPLVGSDVTFTMKAINNSDEEDATNVLIEEILPSGVIYVSHTTTGGEYDPLTGAWTIDKLEKESFVLLVIVVTVDTADEFCNVIEFKSADQRDTKLKNNKYTICLYPELPDLDLAVHKEVYNAVPNQGDHSVFTVTVTNLHSTLSATNVEILDVLHANLVLYDVVVSDGSYAEVDGIWTIPVLGAGQTVSMIMTVVVNGSADNIAVLNSLDQSDVNPLNNEAIASVTVGGSSGGNDGGLESEGSLAELIAQRHFTKSKTNARTVYNSPSILKTYSENLVKSGEITTASRMKTVSNLISLVPENGPFGTKAYVTTPGDLLGISNASEVFSADYFDAGDKRMAAMLGLTTTQGEVYNHTKVICDRLTGASLELVKTVQVDGKSFVMNKLVQANGSLDYAISFIIYPENGTWIIDSRWHQEEYQVPATADVFNLQIWSATPQSTIELMESVLTRLKSLGEVVYRTHIQPEVPVVIVENGVYSDGHILLNVSNPNFIEEVLVKGTLSRYENAARESFIYQLPVVTTNEGQGIVEVPTGCVCDADFSIGPVDGGKRDGLYFADGPWSKDFDSNGARIFDLTRSMHDGAGFADSYLLERSVTMSGEVKTYVSLFRLLKAGSLAVDLSDFDQMAFEAAGTGNIELVIAKASISDWSSQYRTRFSLTPETKTYRIDFDKLISSASSEEFSAEDLISVTLTFTGDGMNFQTFDIELKNMRFTRSDAIQPLQDENAGLQVDVYPNPMRDEGYIEFSLPEAAKVQIMIFDITGKVIAEVCHTELEQGNHRLPIHLEQAGAGIYLVKMNYGHQIETKRINLIR